MDSIPIVQAAAVEKGLPVLAAAEMTTEWMGEMTDILCYGIDPTHPALVDLTSDQLRRQQENIRMVFAALLHQGIALPEDSLPALLDAPLCRQPHALADLLYEHGCGQAGQSVGKLLLKAGLRFEMSDATAVVDTAHQSGGLCLLAHPGRDDVRLPFDAGLLDRFRREVPVDGLEVFYPKHSPEQTAMFCEYAARHGLLVSAGSDSHGPDKPPVQYPAEAVRPLLERLGVGVNPSL